MSLFVSRIILGIVAVVIFRDSEKLLPSLIIGFIGAIISILLYEPNNPYNLVLMKLLYHLLFFLLLILLLYF